MDAGQEVVRILITSAAGDIGRSVAHSAAGGAMLGNNQRIQLRLLDDIQQRYSLQGLRRELLQGDYPLLDDVIIAANTDDGCVGIVFAIVIAKFATRSDYSRVATMRRNYGLFRALAISLQNFAQECRILIVSHPACFGALTLQRFAPAIPARNIMSLTRADQEHAVSLIADRIGVEEDAVHNVVVWGINSSVQHCDIRYAFVDQPNGHVALRELVDAEWLRGDLMRRLQSFGFDISGDPRRVPYAEYSVRGICNHIHDWWMGTAPDIVVSVGMISNGEYNVPAGVLGSFPAYCVDREWVINDALLDGAFMDDRLVRAIDNSRHFHEEAMRVLSEEED